MAVHDRALRQPLQRPRLRRQAGQRPRRSPSPGEIVFTGSGSEANLLALRGTVLAVGHPRPHVIVQATEHPAVLATARALERHHGARVTVLPGDGNGRVDPAALEAALTPDTVLVSIMAANNETGAIQPFAELADP